MDLRVLKAGLVSFSSAFIASLCCLLPLTVVLLGLSSGAFMMVTMQYRWILMPIGVIGVSLGYYLYIREKGRCASHGCIFSGRKLNLSLLIFATVMVCIELAFVLFPALLSELLQRAL
jgi:hypothetical protein